jgi:hypothetical protein
MMKQLDEANLRKQFGTDGRFEFLLGVGTAKGFAPPPKVRKLGARLKVDLALGIHFFYTVVEGRQPCFAVLQEFLSCTAPGSSPHRFLGESLSNDEDRSVNLSNDFGRFTGIGFMAEYAEATWFFPLPKSGRAVLQSPGGAITVTRASKRKTEPWPDYLAAPFNPRSDGVPNTGMFYPLEFKGRGGYVDLTHRTFSSWVKQSINIQITRANGEQLRAKSWVLAFIYRCSDANVKHQHSTLLVHDPPTAPRMPHSQTPARRSSGNTSHANAGSWELAGWRLWSCVAFARKVR